MTPVLTTEQISGQLVFLGTGTSHGIPIIGCGCSTCRSPNRKNQRTRCAVLLGLPEGNLLIDTPPELRLQLVRERVGIVHAVVFTHDHADHLFGLDDLRIVSLYLGGPVPLYCERHVEQSIRTCFHYAFDPAVAHYPAGGVPQLVFRTIDTEPFQVLGAEVTPIRLVHGAFRVLGFRVGQVAYCTDVKRVPEESLPLLENLDVLILDCLRREPHVSHMNLEEALELVDRVRPQQTWLTHICHRLEHEATEAVLPENVRLAYDGLRIPLTNSAGSR